MKKFVLRQSLFLLLSLLLYLTLAYVYFGIGVIGHTGRIKGAGDDPFIWLWFLHWWGYAFSHHLNPFISHVVWVPNGYNVTKSTSILGVYLLSLPLQLFTNVLTSYNILSTFASAFAAWTMLLFCLDMTKKRTISFVAGYLFGFSTYMIGQTLSHINLTAGVFLIPLIVWWVVLVIQARIHYLVAITTITLCLTLLFLVSIEMSATFSICGTMALVIAFFTFPALRARAIPLLIILSISYLLLATITSPYLYYFFSNHRNVAYVAKSSTFNNDLLAFFAPPVFMQFITPLTVSLNQHFNGGAAEQVAYLGFPLMLILILFIYSHWRNRQKRYLIILLLLYLFISLGSVLHLSGGKVVTLLPNKLFFSLPIIHYSLANRYSVYSSFIIAIIVAWWLKENSSHNRRRGKYLLLLLALVALLPCIRPIKGLHPSNVYPCYLTIDNNVTLFENAKVYKKWLRRGDNVLIVPLNYVTYYQTQTNFYFNLIAAYLGLTPEVERHNPLFKFISYRGPALSPAQFSEFIHTKKVDVIILQQQSNRLQPLLQQMGIKPVEIAGTWLYRIKRRHSLISPLRFYAAGVDKNLPFIHSTTMPW
ncbi:MAG: hypothetical protein GY821_08845 [Gammaproteobacteria bacterium]|nr:hypothetical protein [Gammaproteobacteria bacterium]